MTDPDWFKDPTTSTADFIDEALAAAVGRLTIAFSKAEGALDRLLQQLMGVTPPKGNFVTAQVMNLSARMNMTAHLAEAKIDDEALLQDCKNIISAMRKLNTRRNTMLHSDVVRYQRNNNSPPEAMAATLSYYNVRPDGKETSDIYVFSEGYIHELKRFAIRIDAACMVLSGNLEMGKRAVTPPSLEKHPEQPPKDHLFPR